MSHATVCSLGHLPARFPCLAPAVTCETRVKELQLQWHMGQLRGEI